MRKEMTALLMMGMLSVQAKDYNVVDYGAKSDTTVLSTQAIQRAIDDCSRAGGGRVVVPTGIYKIGTVVLKSDVHLFLEQGATLYGSTDLKDYLPMKSDYVSLRTHTTTIQLIYADKVRNVRIDGYGTIDGRGYLSSGANMETIVPIDHVGRINGIRLNNIQVRNAGAMGCSITGLSGHPVEDVSLSDITIHHQGGVAADELAKIDEALKDEKEKEYPEATMWGNLPAKGFYVRHARNIKFNNIDIQTAKPDARPDFIHIDTE